jgi:hypothetical protein
MVRTTPVPLLEQKRLHRKKAKNRIFEQISLWKILPIL